MPGIGMESRGRTASRTMTTERNKSQIANVFRSPSVVKVLSKRRKKFSPLRGAKRLREKNPKATIRTKRISVGNCSIVLPLAEFILRNILGFRTWMDVSGRLQHNRFPGPPCVFPELLSFDFDLGFVAGLAGRCLVALFPAEVRHFQAQVAGVG